MLSRVRPGEIRDALPARAPEHGEAFDADLRRLRADHPSRHHPLEPSRLLRLLRDHRAARPASWRSSCPPRSTSAGDAVAHVAGGDRARRGRARLAAAAARPARHRSRASSTTRRRSRRCTRSRRRAKRRVAGVRARGLAGRIAICRRFASTAREHAHSSVDKAVILLGLGHDALHADSRGRASSACGPTRSRAPSRTIARRDACRSPSSRPSARTSSTSVDPVAEIAAICARERVWLHVDAAYAGVAAMVPGLRVDPARRRARRLARRQSAQVAVHAVRSERALLPPHGRPARRRSR